MHKSALIVAVFGLGCGGGGRLELVLDLPDGGILRPEGMTTVTVVAQPFEDDPVATTSVIENNRFEAGELPAGEPVALAVELRDGTGRLVGYGRALAPVELSADHLTEVRIAVRRPFLYATSTAAPTTGLFTFDPTRSALDMAYQGRLAPPSPVRTVPLGGDWLAVVSGSDVSLLSTEDHMISGDSIALGGTATDAAQVPGERQIVVGMATGMAIVDLDSGDVRAVPGGAVSRVAVGVTADGRVVAWGLIDRVAPPEINEACSGTSQLMRVDLANPDEPSTVGLSVGLADIAAGVDAPALVGAAPCLGQVVSIDEEQITEVADLARAAQVAIQGTRVWAVGTRPAVLVMQGATIDYVDVDAITLVASVDIRGGTPTTFEVPRQRQQMNDRDDPAREHAQVMKPMSAAPLDMVVLAGGEFIAIATRYRFHSAPLTMTDPIFGNITVLPQMDAITADVQLITGADRVLAQRVRTTCMLSVGAADIFPNWECAGPETGQAPDFGEYEAAALGALFGAR